MPKLPKRKLPARRCGECKKPLSDGAHWNRRFCPTGSECAKKRRRKRDKRPPSKRGAGPPSLCTPMRIKLITQAAELGAYRKDCAAHAGVSDAALGKWLQQGHDAMLEAGIDPEMPPDDFLELVPEKMRPYVRLRAEYLRVRARGLVTLLHAQHKAGVGGPVYAPDPNALKPEEYDEIAQVLAAVGRGDLIPALRRPEQKQVGFLDPDPRAAARALAVSHGYTETRQIELSAEVRGAAQPSLCIFLPPEEEESDDG